MKPTGYVSELRTYWRASAGARDFARLMQVRLSRSKLRWAVCPRRKSVSVHLRELGKSVILRSHTSDIFVLNELVLDRGYDPVLAFLPDPVRVVVDLGANVGLVSRWILDKYPDAQVIAVEPEPGNAAVLRRNLEATGKRFIVIQACAGASERQVMLNTDGAECACSMDDGPTAGGISVPVLTMQQILSGIGDSSIDLLKCDIEGAEAELFDACESWIGRVKVIVAELHGAYTAAHLIDALRRNGGEFDLLHRNINQSWQCETVILKTRDRSPTGDRCAAP